jgi:hypothetical protein
MYIFFYSLTLALVNSRFLYRRYHQEQGADAWVRFPSQEISIYLCVCSGDRSILNIMLNFLLQFLLYYRHIIMIINYLNHI